MLREALQVAGRRAPISCRVAEPKAPAGHFRNCEGEMEVTVCRAGAGWGAELHEVVLMRCVGPT